MILLNAVNIVLRALGEGRVQNVDLTHPSVQMALDVIDEVKVAKLGGGYWFNRDYKYPINPNQAGELVLPVDTIGISVDYPNQQLKRRGDKLYDSYTHTFLINRAVTAELVVDMPFDDLPVLAQTAIAYEAAAIVVSDDDGDTVKWDRLKTRATEASLNLESENMKRMQYNALNAPHSARLRAGVHGAVGGNPSGDYIGGRPRY